MYKTQQRMTEPKIIIKFTPQVQPDQTLLMVTLSLRCPLWSLEAVTSAMLDP